MIWLILVLVLIMGYYALSLILADSEYDYLLVVGAIVLNIIATIALVKKEDIGYNKGQIDALKGIQTHEIHYTFPEGDTIPSDTLYVKIK